MEHPRGFHWKNGDRRIHREFHVYCPHRWRNFLFVIVNQQFQRRLLVDNESPGNVPMYGCE